MLVADLFCHQTKLDLMDVADALGIRSPFVV